MAGVFALTGKQYSAKLSLSPKTLAAVQERYGDLEPSFRAATGRGFDSLTESEGRYLARVRSPESIRDRIAAEGAAAQSGVRSDPVGRSAEGVESDKPAESRGAAATRAPPPSTASRIEDRLRDNALGKICAFAQREPLAKRRTRDVR